MSDLDDIVSVNITTDSPPLNQAGFGVPLVLGYHAVFSERYRSYNSMQSAQQDGFGISTPIGRALLALFSQQPSVARVVVGRATKPPIEALRIHSDGGFVDGTYTITFDAVSIDVDIPDGDSASVAASLNLAISEAYTDSAAPAQISVATTGDTTDLLVEASDVSPFASFSIVGPIPGRLSTSDITESTAIGDDISELAALNRDWYALILASQTRREILAAAAAIEKLRKIFVAATSDEDVLDPTVDTDIASELFTRYERTLLLWHHEPESHPAAAWAGVMLPLQPGRATWAYKRLAGISPTTSLTDNHKTAIVQKNANYYDLKSVGLAVTTGGMTPAGDYIDCVGGDDFLYARLQERIFRLLASSEKIPYTDAGAAAIEAEVRAVLNLCVSNDILAADPEPQIHTTPVAQIPATERGKRHYPGIRFSAIRAGAIHKVLIEGRITV